jgi:hypothetical protein
MLQNVAMVAQANAPKQTKELNYSTAFVLHGRGEVGLAPDSMQPSRYAALAG